MQTIDNEEQLYHHRYIVAGRHPKPHFQGYYHLLFDRLSDLDIVVYMKELSETFLKHYEGNIVCLAPHYARKIAHSQKKYKIVLISHGPLPMSCRSSKTLKADHIITNGSESLMKHIDVSCIGQVCLAGYFPTAYAVQERREKTALVQITGKYQCNFTPVQVCRLLLDKGFEVFVYNHLMYKSDFKKLPKEIIKVSSGLEYIQTLSSCSHFVFSGTSGFITNMFTPGACMIVLSNDWVSRNKDVFQQVIGNSCFLVQDDTELKKYLACKSKYGEEEMAFLYGRNRANIIEKINDYLIKIQ